MVLDFIHLEQQFVVDDFVEKRISFEQLAAALKELDPDGEFTNYSLFKDTFNCARDYPDRLKLVCGVLPWTYSKMVQ